MNIGGHRFFWIGESGFLEYNPSNGITWSKGSSIFSFRRKLYTALHSGCTSLHSHSALGFPFLRILASSVVCWFVNHGHSDQGRCKFSSSIPGSTPSILRVVSHFLSSSLNLSVSVPSPFPLGKTLPLPMERNLFLWIVLPFAQYHIQGWIKQVWGLLRRLLPDGQWHALYLKAAGGRGAPVLLESWIGILQSELLFSIHAGVTYTTLSF